ncbi:pentapeptide repeat protein [Thalassoporum mexicanum PCC 7367]|uniref:pentapeptide repeat-containing protein n=1 Tax=Thalassoporum mexicanum TaxID=3457544 RepID=UPI00029FB403|nr:pentapeptide repeat protein [Pseudanabaena sp. PCC 7367]
MKTTTLAVSILSMFFGFVGFGLTAGAENIEDVRQFIQTKKCPGCALSFFFSNGDHTQNYRWYEPSLITYAYNFLEPASYVVKFRDSVDDTSDIDIDFSQANLSKADLYGATLLFNFTNANLSNADLRAAHLRGRFEGADFSGADLRNALLSGNLKGANFNNANLSRAKFILRSLVEVIDLRGANLRNADLSYVSISHADLRGADLRGANVDFMKVSIPFVHPEKGFVAIGMLTIDENTLLPPKLSILYEIAREGGVGKDLSNLDLSNSYLGMLDLRGADLSGSNLSNSILHSSDLGGANLQNANLSGANLVDANFKDANLDSAILDGVVWCAPEIVTFVPASEELALALATGKAQPELISINECTKTNIK